MRAYEFPNFGEAIQQCSYQMQYRSKQIHTDRWQGVVIGDKPDMAMHELTHVNFGVNLEPYRVNPLVGLAADIRPNLPWADDHFDERVCGQPINPGIQWENWPYNRSAASFLENGKFNHNYMERYWPKFAGYNANPTYEAPDWMTEEVERVIGLSTPNTGIKYEYGDLNDVVELLCSDPHTRQAYLPVWFPEDTGGGSKRAPCTIGYHFLMRENQLSINYEIRSCDFVRHFRDDLYLTTRLLLWMIDQCRARDPLWDSVVPGKFFIQIGSLHVFRNDYLMMFGGKS